MAVLNVEYPQGRPFVPARQGHYLRPLPAGMVARVSEGDHVSSAQIIAERAAGVEAAVPPGAGERAGILAGISGRVVEVVAQRHIAIKGIVAVFQGAMGLGGQSAGPLALLPRGELPAIVPIPAGCVIVFPGQLPLTFMQRAAANGALGVIAGSASAREFEAFARADLSAVLDELTSPPQLLALTIVLTEGLGDYPMRPALFQMLAQRVNTPVLLDGTTLPHRNRRPEIIFPLPPGAPPEAVPADSGLASGVMVGVAAGERRGMSGVIAHLFTRRQATAAGFRVPSASVRLDDGSTVVLPLHVLDRIG